ncbi:class I SAM-dependent methyltransferase [Nakamurella deserti]|uniref:class I SAM-dependent methyltransferase n=1 Tax=Nakamurella deserti TaxID=2164074 RepID=UPI00197B822F|nr:class I SAM-dependent methyltransferase [Nakamurella deserti]
MSRPGGTGRDDADRVRRDYDAVAQAYDDLVRHDRSSTHTLSTAMITAFGRLVRDHGTGAPVLDAGCGPGQWTELLADLGIAVRGLDVSSEMIAIARRHRPDLRFEVGSLLRTGAADHSLGGVLAHFSLIHLDPADLPSALAEFARALEPGAPLLLGMQVAVEPGAGGWVAHGDHRASPAYAWDLDALAAHLDRHGFTEMARLRIEPLEEGRPPPGYLLARHAPAGRQLG